MSRAAEDLETALALHRAALAAFAERARRVAPEDWERPRAPGKWSPAEITEHLRLAAEKLRAERQGEEGMQLRLSAWKRFLLRRTVLVRLLRTGRFPKGAPAPREIRPVSPGLPQDEALDRLERAWATFEDACRSGVPTVASRLTHPYFGRLRLAQYHRLLAVHTLHHRDQLPVRP